MILSIEAYTHLIQNGNATPAVAAAVRDLPDGGTLLLGGRTLHLFPDGAPVATYFISNNDGGNKPIAFRLAGKRGIVIDGGGADLIFHGRILPFVVDHSDDVVVKNLSIDYHTPFFAQPEIVASDRTQTVLRFSDDAPCTVMPDGQFCFPSPDAPDEVREKVFAIEFLRDETGATYPSPVTPPVFLYTGAPKDHGFLRGMFRDVTLSQPDPHTVCIHGDLGFAYTPGNHLLMPHTTREFPGIFITESRAVRLESVRLYHTASMGVIAQLSENLTLHDVVAAPRPGSGRMISVNADATHFVNCRGRIALTNCKFISMNDDACNIHGIYACCTAQPTADTVICGFGHHQQQGINLFRPGDRVALIDSDCTQTRALRTVVASELRGPNALAVTLDAPLPPIGPHDVLENRSTAPEVYIADCESGYNRPRGFLLSSAGRTVVVRCRFYNMNAGIQIGGELCDWFESGAVTDVTIRDCDFANSAYAGGTAISIVPKLRAPCADGFFHGNIRILDNRFVQSTPRVLQAEQIAHLIFRGNTFRHDPSLPVHPSVGDGICVQRCGTAEMEPLKID